MQPIQRLLSLNPILLHNRMERRIHKDATNGSVSKSRTTGIVGENDVKNVFVGTREFAT